MRALLDIPTRVQLGRGALERVGLELAAMGARKVTIVTEEGAEPLGDRVAESVRRAGGAVAGLRACGALDEGCLEAVARDSAGCDAIVAVSGWIAASAAMHTCDRLGLELVTVAVPPSFSSSLAVAPVPPRGVLAARRPAKQPALALFDPSLFEAVPRDQVVAEVALLAMKGSAMSRLNALAGRLARDALEELRAALARSEPERLAFSALLAALSVRVGARGLAPSALAWALHALLGVDPFKAELSIFPAWLSELAKRVGEAGAPPLAPDDVELARRAVEGLAPPSLGQLGVKAAKVDLVVECAWTYWRYDVEADPVIEDKWDLRELLRASL